MPYSDEQRQAALDCLAANDGDYHQTSADMGIPVGTLRRWAKGTSAESRGDRLARLRAQLTAYKEHLRSSPTPDDLVKAAETELLLSITDDAIRLSESIEEVIADASLSQRATALNQMIDKILKLSKELPKTGEQVIRIEYIWPDGTTHDAPPWAAEDPEQQGAL